ncbi:M56 family metallopeptidase [Rufibacter immobilis]|uniref:M56 family metallopeptidase n=1 Tax=Rufibacter immobilis TaxID=1348778 RepID=UPI0035EE8729
MTPQTLLHDVLPEAVIHALGWTLLHSLWQGALMALLLAVLLRLMHRHSAAVRYRVSWGALMVLLAVSFITFCQLYEPGAGHATPMVSAGSATTSTVLATTAPALPVWQQLLEKGQAYFSQHLPVVVLLWLLGMLLMGLRVLGGWVYVQRLKSYRTRAVAEAWQQKTQDLCQALGITQAVQLAESALVRVPMVIGHFKPLILLPLGALAGLSVQQVEAILAHELAHVHRRDYLLNLLQSMVETLFFFHPAVWWISDCARTEREHACDDLALALCGDSLTYAYALTNLEELMMKKNPSTPRLAMAFSGRRRSLLGRITRLVQKSTTRPSFSEGFLASCAVIAGVLVFSASAWANYPLQAGQEQDSSAQEKPQLAQAPVTTVAPEGAQSLQEEDLTLQQLEDGLVIVQNKKGKVVEVYVNGQRVPKSELGKYQDRIQQQLAAAKKGKTLKTEEEVISAMSHVETTLESIETEEDGEVPAPPVPPAPLAPMAPMPPMPQEANSPRLMRIPVPPVAPVAPVRPGTDNEDSNKKYRKAMQDYEARMRAYQAKMEEYSARYAAYAAQNPAHQERLMELHNRRIAQHELRQKEHEKRMAQHEVRMQEHNERMKKHNQMMEALKTALVEDKLIPSAEANYELKLDKTGLYLNGNKQSEALFEKYKKLMGKASGEDMDVMLEKKGSNFHIKSNVQSK